MAYVSLADRYGLPNRAEHSTPQQILLVLGYGPFRSGLCSPRPRIRSRCWLRVAALPVRDPLVTPPFERLLVPLSGGGTRLEAALCRSEAAGCQLFVGFDDVYSLHRARSLLAPGCDLEMKAPRDERAWTVLGLTHRIQGELRDTVDGRSTPAAAMDQLAGIDGDWLVHWQIEGVSVHGIDEFAETLLRLDDAAAANVTRRPHHDQRRDSHGWCRRCGAECNHGRRSCTPMPCKAAPTGFGPSTPGSRPTPRPPSTAW